MAISVDEVREELGGPDEELISDDKIQSIIDREQSFNGSCAAAARVIANAFALKADIEMGPVSVEYQDRADRWEKIASQYKEQMALDADPFVGGISEADKEARASDEDRPSPDFSRDMFSVEGDEFDL